MANQPEDRQVLARRDSNSDVEPRPLAAAAHDQTNQYQPNFLVKLLAFQSPFRGAYRAVGEKLHCWKLVMVMVMLMWQM